MPFNAIPANDTGLPVITRLGDEPSLLSLDLGSVLVNSAYEDEGAFDTDASGVTVSLISHRYRLRR